MATNNNQYVVNLVDLQSIAISITGNPSGPGAIQQLQSDVGNLQEMVDYTTKTIKVDAINEFTPGHGIEVLANLTTVNTTTTTTNQSPTSSMPVQGIVSFVYSAGAFSGSTSGSLPTSFASSVTATGTTITITLNPRYSSRYFPNYYGTITWHTPSGYLSFSIPNSSVVFTGTQLIVSNLTMLVLTGITPDSSGYSLWLTLSALN